MSIEPEKLLRMQCLELAKGEGKGFPLEVVNAAAMYFKFVWSGEITPTTCPHAKQAHAEV